MDGRTIDHSKICTWTGAVVGAAVATAVACLALAQDGKAEGAKTEVPVAMMAIGQAPPGFDFQRTGRGQPGRWVVVADDSANGGRAIEQASSDRTDNRFPLAVLQAPSAKNVEVTVRFKAMAGQVDRAGGIAVRVTSADDYYVVCANALEDNVRFYRVVKGAREQIAGADIKTSAPGWHALGLKAENDRFTISFDGKRSIPRAIAR
jgi:hypothetical protein